MYEKCKHPFSVEQLNAELHHAHIELINAHCATHQIRLHYSTADLARFGRRDILRKSAEAASSLNQFYSEIERAIPSREPSLIPEPAPEQVAQAITWLGTYLRKQREHYLPVAGPLTAQYKTMLQLFYSRRLLDNVRVLELHGACVDVPDYFAEIRAAGFEPPEVSHLDSLTFQDVVVFNHQITLRALFHALVHTVQIEVLGVERYAELWVHSFVKNRTHFTVPLEVHAFSLASKFLSPLAEKFSVEEHVLRWSNDGRYSPQCR